MTQPAPTIPAPPLDAENGRFFAEAAEGRLTTRRCEACGRLHFYPRARCPHCGSGKTFWERLSGGGTVYTASATYRAGPAPYAIAYVALDEGVTMLTNIVGCEPGTVAIGQRVRVVFQKAENGVFVPMFAPE
jgi:uncharacterized OB-fold protein